MSRKKLSYERHKTKGVSKNIVLRHFFWKEKISREIVQMVHLYKVNMFYINFAKQF